MQISAKQNLLFLVVRYENVFIFKFGEINTYLNKLKTLNSFSNWQIFVNSEFNLIHRKQYTLYSS